MRRPARGHPCCSQSSPSPPRGQGQGPSLLGRRCSWRLMATRRQRRRRRESRRLLAPQATTPRSQGRERRGRCRHAAALWREGPGSAGGPRGGVGWALLLLKTAACFKGLQGGGNGGGGSERGACRRVHSLPACCACAMHARPICSVVCRAQHCMWAVPTAYAQLAESLAPGEGWVVGRGSGFG